MLGDEFSGAKNAFVLSSGESAFHLLAFLHEDHTSTYAKLVH